MLWKDYISRLGQWIRIKALLIPQKFKEKIIRKIITYKSSIFKTSSFDLVFIALSAILSYLILSFPVILILLIIIIIIIIITFN